MNSSNHSSLSSLSHLPGLGPKSLAMLEAAGITDLNQLQRLGAVAAYLQVKQQCRQSSLNLLWALEGALTGQHWQTVARQDRLRLLLELERIQAANL